MRYQTLLCFAFGFLLLLGGVEEYSRAQGLPGANENYQIGVIQAGGIGGVFGNPTQACSRNLGFIEGGFGALVASAAGIGAIISCAVGGFRSAWCLLIVSIGSFILRSYLTLFHAGCRAL